MPSHPLLPLSRVKECLRFNPDVEWQFCPTCQHFISRFPLLRWGVVVTFCYSAFDCPKERQLNTQCSWLLLFTERGKGASQKWRSSAVHWLQIQSVQTVLHDLPQNWPVTWSGVIAFTVWPIVSWDVSRLVVVGRLPFLLLILSTSAVLSVWRITFLPTPLRYFRHQIWKFQHECFVSVKAARSRHKSADSSSECAWSERWGPARARARWEGVSLPQWRHVH